MRLSRRLTNAVRWVLDQLVPPLLRDSRWFSFLVLYPVARHKTRLVLDFRERFPGMSADELARCYRETAGLITRETDLGARSFEYLVRAISGGTVLEVGAGRGHLARALARVSRVTACDFATEACTDAAGVTWVQAHAEHLPFPDASFDVVVCTHTLEHVRDFEAALAELRRVGRWRLYIVVPLQRPYRYTPDLHVWYFPYPHAFLTQARPRPGSFSWRILDGDLLYEERLAARAETSAAASSPTTVSAADQGNPGSR